MTHDPPIRLEELSRRLSDRVLAPLKSSFVGKDDIIDLMGVCLVGGEHLFLHGPPGTAKSALVTELARHIDGKVFDYLLTRFTEPSELFGPFDIRKLREGELITNTEGMLPEASFVFLDELLNANSAILNSLLMALNERVFRRGRETRALPMLMAVGASNHLPEDEALRALFDRFLVRVRCDNVAAELLPNVLHAGWSLDHRVGEATDGMAIDEIRELQRLVRSVNVENVMPAYIDLIHRLRHAGIAISDRRAVKFQRLVAASAILCGRSRVETSDLWVVHHTWDTTEQEEVIRELVRQVVEGGSDSETGPRHPQSVTPEKPDPESLARDLDLIAERLEGEKSLSDADRRALRDRVTIHAGRCEWVADDTRRTLLKQRIDQLWTQLGSGR